MFTLLSFASVMKYIGYIVIAILVLLLMVLIHELGHYIAGKALKFKINEFSIGFGPKIFQRKNKSGELISLRAFPLGGYCAFEGEDENKTNNPEAFNSQKPWKRLIVLFSGAFFNFLSAIIFSFILLLANGYDLVEVDKVNTNSINYGIIQTGDVIHGVDGNNIDFVKDEHFNILINNAVKKYYNKYSGEETELQDEESFTSSEKTYYLVIEQLTYNIKRDGKKFDLVGYINVIYDEQGNYSGWTMLSTYTEDTDEFKISSYEYSFSEALTQAVPFTCKWAYKVVVIFGQLITGKLSITSLGGPITTVNTIASYTQQSASYLLLLLPLIAVNLAVFNLLPIPALDGFQMIFVLIEWIRKKPVKREVINIINNVGLIVLIGFVLIVDIIQIII